MTAAELIVWGTVAHLIADWFLQNDWMAANKVDPAHQASWIHAFVHMACLNVVFPWWSAWLLGISHFLIDLRWPLERYRAVMGQAMEGNPVAVHVKIWQDQAAHVLCIAVAALVVGGA